MLGQRTCPRVPKVQQWGVSSEHENDRPHTEKEAGGRTNTK